MMLKGIVLVGGVLLAAMPTDLLAQVGGCSACETAIRDKLTELDDRTGKTNLLVKSVDRKLDPLAVKVDAIDTKLTAVQAKLDGIAAAAPPAKSAVVIEFGGGIAGPLHSPGFVGPIKTEDALATEYCVKINYTFGRALAKIDVINGSTVISREIRKLVCYM